MNISKLDIEREAGRLQRSLYCLQESLQEDRLPSGWSENFRADMGLFQDYGLITASYDLCESVTADESPCAAADRDLAHAFLAHMDLSRGKDRDSHLARYQSYLDHGDSLLQAHGCLGLGINAIHLGEALEAIAWFQRSRASFKQVSGKALYVIKSDILEIMALRIMERHDEAFSLTLKAIEKAQQLGPCAAAALLLLYSVAAGHNTFVGKRHEGQRYSWQAVRLANALPASKAAGFAYFQHARGLHALGKVGEAIAYMKKADPVLKVFDPLARIANQMLWFQSLKAQEKWTEAGVLLEQLLETRLVEYFWEDLAELLLEGIDFFIRLHDINRGRKMLKLYQSYAEVSEKDLEKRHRLVQEVQERLSLVEQKLKSSDSFGYGAIIVIVDFTSQRLVRKSPYGIICKNLAKAPGSMVILKKLHKSLQSHEPLLPRKQIMEAWKAYQQDHAGKYGSDPGKTMRRNLQVLVDMEVLSIHGSGNQMKISLGEGSKVHFLRDNIGVTL